MIEYDYGPPNGYLGRVINNPGSVNQVPTNNGDGTISWKAQSGGGGGTYTGDENTIHVSVGNVISIPTAYPPTVPATVLGFMALTSSAIVVGDSTHTLTMRRAGSKLAFSADGSINLIGPVSSTLTIDATGNWSFAPSGGAVSFQVQANGNTGMYGAPPVPQAADPGDLTALTGVYATDLALLKAWATKIRNILSQAGGGVGISA